MTPHHIKTWQNYQTEVREFDAILEYSRSVSSSLVGLQPPNRHASYGEQIYVKLLAHCVILRRLAPDPQRRTQAEFWDVPSISAISRCVIEAHDAFMYVVAVGTPDPEKEFRLLLWETHDKCRRAHMLDAIGSKGEKVDEIRTERDRLLKSLQQHPTFDSLRPDLKKKISKGDPPAFHLSQRELCKEWCINYDYYNAVTMQLSQYVHTFPFSVHQMFSFKAGTLEGLRLMALPMQFALPFLIRATETMRELFPSRTQDPPSRTARSMFVWRTISVTGTKGAA